jgi:putative transposase
MNDALFSDLALERYQIIRSHIEDEVPVAQLARQHGKSERTLRRWLVRFHEKGLAGLERQARSDRGHRRKLQPALVNLIERYVLQKPPLPIAVIHRRLVTHSQSQDLPSPSYAVVYDIVKHIDPALRTLAQKGGRAYRQQYDLLHRHEASAANELWQADHTLLDIVLLDEKQVEKRPWLTVIIDDYSRALCGYYLSFAAPNTVNTALALRQAIWHKANPKWPICGIPQVLYVDNGSDFTSTHLEQACINLKIRLIHSPPGQPRGRGKVERFFQTLNQILLSELPGYLHNGQRLSPPTLDLTTLMICFETFVHETYHQQVHNTTHQAPVLRWQGQDFLPNLPDTRQALDLLLLRVSKTRQVQRDGIRFQALRYIEPTLAAFVGEAVEIRYDPRDLAEIQVYHQGKFVCRAICQDIADQTLSLRDIRQSRNRRRAALRAELNHIQNAQLVIETDDVTSIMLSPKPTRKQPLKRYHHE